jgi:hypothetical protein
VIPEPLQSTATASMMLKSNAIDRASWLEALGLNASRLHPGRLGDHRIEQLGLDRFERPESATLIRLSKT